MTARIRTIEEAYHEIKQADPNTALTKNYIRSLVLNGLIPIRKAGKKVLISMDSLEEYLRGGS